MERNNDEGRRSEPKEIVLMCPSCRNLDVESNGTFSLAKLAKPGEYDTAKQQYEIRLADEICYFCLDR